MCWRRQGGWLGSLRNHNSGNGENYRLVFTFPIKRWIRSFHFVILQKI